MNIWTFGDVHVHDRRCEMVVPGEVMRFMDDMDCGAATTLVLMWQQGYPDVQPVFWPLVDAQAIHLMQIGNNQVMQFDCPEGRA